MTNKYFCFIAIAFLSILNNIQAQSFWNKVKSESIVYKYNVSELGEENYFYKLDIKGFKEKLDKAPLKKTFSKGIVLEFPNQEGVLEMFEVWEYSNFEPELQAKYPEIRAYSGVGITNKTATINFSISPQGIQTMVLRADKASEFIAAYSNDTEIYKLTTSENRKNNRLPFTCKTEDKILTEKIISNKANNQIFRTFRLALSCTGEYTQYFGGTKAQALAAMNATMTRVNGVFNKDLAVQLIIIGNNDSIIFTDPASDPYNPSSSGLTLDKNDNEFIWSKQLQTTLNTKIGNENYDIGHLFGDSGGGGNAGCIGCICENDKGKAFTSPADGKPQGDNFDIDFVAHEMGHQLGANHTFSYYKDEITGNNVEPGSGSTIMAYAGVTKSYDVQPHSDDYFHVRSIQQIQNNLNGKCSNNSTISTDIVVETTPNFVIPKGTAFVLKGTASGTNSSNYTYCWEQNDSISYEYITQTTENNSKTYPTKPNGPMFRSFKPTSNPIRYFPSLDKVLNNKLTSDWESVSSIDKKMNFYFTVRNNAEQGKGQTNTETTLVTVNDKTGPFEITSQNTTDLSWYQNTSQSITWNVNETDKLPGAQNVNIRLSKDGGLTFPIYLATNTPNDGSEFVIVPETSCTNCRLLIEPTNNIFYAINKTPFALNYIVNSQCNTYSFPFKFPYNIPNSNNFNSQTVTVPSNLGTITNVTYNLDVTHTSFFDLQVQVLNPQGKEINLYNRNCLNNGTLKVNFTDLGDDFINCNNPIQQNVRTSPLLNSYNDADPVGNWTFKIIDNKNPLNKGTLNAASVTICTKTYTPSNEPTTASSEPEPIIVYPNPSNGIFNFKYTSKTNQGFLVIITDINGKKVFEKRYIDSTKYYIEKVFGLQHGLYLFTIIDQGKKTTKKIIVE